MTISVLANGSTDVNMESHYEQNAYKIPDEFWDEVQNMISEFDIAFDEELIHLKETESEIAEPGHNVSGEPNSDEGNKGSLKPSSDTAVNESKGKRDGNYSDDCEIVGVTKISDKERKHRIRSTSSSSASTDSSPKRKKKHKREKRKRDKRKSKKKHNRKSRSRSSSLEKMKEAIRKRLRESELLDEIQKLEAEKRRRLKSISPLPYEPFKINLPDMNFKPVKNPLASTSKDVKITGNNFFYHIMKKNSK